METVVKNLQCAIHNASKFADWIKNRGGVALWRSINLSNPGASWSSPAMTKDDPPIPTSKPSWQCANEPERVITDPNEIDVYKGEEVKRFHVAVRMGSQGFSMKVTDGGTRRIEAELEKAGEDSFYEFDYDDYKNCVIMKPKVFGTLAEFIKNEYVEA